MDEIHHNIVARTYSGGNRRFAFLDQRLRVAEPHVRAVGKPGYPDQIGKFLRLGVNNHLHGKIRTKLRDAERPKGAAADVLRRNAERFGIFKQRHDRRIVQRDALGI